MCPIGFPGAQVARGLRHLATYLTYTSVAGLTLKIDHHLIHTILRIALLGNFSWGECRFYDTDLVQYLEEGH